MECTSIKFELFWRKISRKDGCKGVSENARVFFCTSEMPYVYRWMRVPVFPKMPSFAFSNKVIKAVRPSPERAKFTAA